MKEYLEIIRNIVITLYSNLIELCLKLSLTFGGGHLIYFAGICLCIVLTLLHLNALSFRVLRLVYPYPMTEFGFRGRLIYADVKGSSVFVNHAYKVIAKPDFVFRLNNGKYVVLELKSRLLEVLDSDIAQLEIGILAVRSKFPVKAAAVVLGDGSITWIETAKCSSPKLFKRNRKEINIVKKIKSGQKMTPQKSERCIKCVKKKDCWG